MKRQYLKVFSACLLNRTTQNEVLLKSMAVKLKTHFRTNVNHGTLTYLGTGAIQSVN